jgi:hypothetical protein
MNVPASVLLISGMNANHNPEPVVRRPLWGYLHDYCSALLFAQRDTGIDTLLGRSFSATTPAQLSFFAGGNATSQAFFNSMKRRHAVFNPPLAAQAGMPCDMKLIDVAIAQIEDLNNRGLINQPSFGDDQVQITAAWPLVLCVPPPPPPPPPAILIATSNTLGFGGRGVASVPPVGPQSLAALGQSYYYAGVQTIASNYTNGNPPGSPWVPPQNFFALLDYTMSPVALGSALSPFEWVSNGGSMEPRFNFVDLPVGADLSSQPTCKLRLRRRRC